MLVDTNLISAFLRRDAETRTPKLFEFVTDLVTRNDLFISFVTQYELRRGAEKLVRQGAGRKKLVEIDKFIERAQVLGLDAGFGEGWNLAARLWADGRAQKPARVFEDADLLHAATAAYYGRGFATSDAKLAARLAEIAYAGAVVLVKIE